MIAIDFEKYVSNPQPDSNDPVDRTFNSPFFGFTNPSAANSTHVPGIVDQTVRLSRLKMLYMAAKISKHSNRDRVYYSIHESRASGIINFLDYLDRRRAEKIPKLDAG